MNDNPYDPTHLETCRGHTKHVNVCMTHGSGLFTLNGRRMCLFLISVFFVPSVMYEIELDPKHNPFCPEYEKHIAPYPTPAPVLLKQVQASHSHKLSHPI